MQSGVCPSGSKKKKSQNKPFSRPTYTMQPGVCPAGSKTHFWISKNSFSSSMKFHAVWRLSIWFERKCQHTRFSVYGTSFRLEFLHVAKNEANMIAYDHYNPWQARGYRRKQTTRQSSRPVRRRFKQSQRLVGRRGVRPAAMQLFCVQDFS